MRMIRVHTKEEPESPAPFWIQVIWECNKLAEGRNPLFGKPNTIGKVEEYDEARIVFDEDSVRIVSLSRRGDQLLQKAAANLGIESVQVTNAN